MIVSVQRMVKLSAVWRVFGGESCSGRSFLFTSVIIAQRSRTGHDGFHIDLQQRDKEREAGCTTNQQGEKIKIYSELIKTSFRSINLVFYFPHEHCDNHLNCHFIWFIQIQHENIQPVFVFSEVSSCFRNFLVFFFSILKSGTLRHQLILTFHVVIILPK